MLSMLSVVSAACESHYITSDVVALKERISFFGGSLNRELPLGGSAEEHRGTWTRRDGNALAYHISAPFSCLNTQKRRKGAAKAGGHRQGTGAPTSVPLVVGLLRLDSWMGVYA